MTEVDLLPTLAFLMNVSRWVASAAKPRIAARCEPSFCQHENPLPAHHHQHFIARPLSPCFVTGAAGFIGMHCAKRLLERGDEVLGIDNLSPYYSVDLKKARLKRLEHDRFRFVQMDLVDAESLTKTFEREKPSAVLHLAAQPACATRSEPGVVRAIQPGRLRQPPRGLPALPAAAPGVRVELERLRQPPKLPWSESDNVDHPISLYAPPRSRTS